MKTTLVIIDMQPKFEAAINIIDSVIHQINLAKHRKDGIVLVEYGHNNLSYSRIYKALYDYNQFVVTHKDEDCGSEEVIEIILKENYSFDRIRFCGVNICACVRLTILGILKKDFGKKIEFVEDACACVYYHYRPNCIASLKKRINLKD